MGIIKIQYRNDLAYLEQCSLPSEAPLVEVFTTCGSPCLELVAQGIGSWSPTTKRKNQSNKNKNLFPTCQVRVSKFYHELLPPSFLPSFLPPFLPSSQQRRRAPDLSGHCRTSTAKLRSQWALADLRVYMPHVISDSMSETMSELCIRVGITRSKAFFLKFFQNQWIPLPSGNQSWLAGKSYI